MRCSEGLALEPLLFMGQAFTDKTWVTVMYYQLDFDFQITGTLLDAAIRIPEEIFTRDKPLYFATINPTGEHFEARHEIEQVFAEAIGSDAELRFDEDQPRNNSDLRFESIKRPNYGLNEFGEVAGRPGEEVQLDVRLQAREVYGETRAIVYPRLMLRSIFPVCPEPLPEEYFGDSSFN